MTLPPLKAAIEQVITNLTTLLDQHPITALDQHPITASAIIDDDDPETLELLFDLALNAALAVDPLFEAIAIQGSVNGQTLPYSDVVSAAVSEDLCPTLADAANEARERKNRGPDPDEAYERRRDAQMEAENES
jgi:hypothetical protein